MVTDFARRLKAARKLAGLSQKQLAPLAGMSQSNLSGLETQGYQSGKTAQLAAACGVEAHWLATGEGPMLDSRRTAADQAPAPYWTPVHHSSGGPQAGVAPTAHAQKLSHVQAAMIPRKLAWEGIVSAELPERFSLQVLDDAMALSDPPSMRPGDIAIFSPANAARPGQVVLVADANGNAYIRRFQQRTPTHWEAVARNGAYAPLDSARDGLRIVAIQIGGLWAF